MWCGAVMQDMSMPISQEKLGRFAVIRRYRWALAGSIFWSISTLVYITLIVLAAVTGRSLGFQEIFWLVLSVGFVIQSGISVMWHRRERAAGRFEVD